MTVGHSVETSEFITDCLGRWYHWQGQSAYPQAQEVLLLLDCGGPSGANRKVFKEDLIHLSARLEVKFRVAHYPSYTSKWNPIEHRVFCHVERSLGGMILDSYEKVREAIARGCD